MAKHLSTKNGEPLRLQGDNVFDSSGRHVGRRQGNKIYGLDGKYRGTIHGDTVVYRSVGRAGISTSLARHANIGRDATARRVRSAIWGQEPSFD